VFTVEGSRRFAAYLAGPLRDRGRHGVNAYLAALREARTRAARLRSVPGGRSRTRAGQVGTRPSAATRFRTQFMAQPGPRRPRSKRGRSRNGRGQRRGYSLVSAWRGGAHRGDRRPPPGGGAAGGGRGGVVETGEGATASTPCGRWRPSHSLREPRVRSPRDYAVFATTSGRPSSRVATRSDCGGGRCRSSPNVWLDRSRFFCPHVDDVWAARTRGGPPWRPWVTVPRGARDGCGGGRASVVCEAA